MQLRYDEDLIESVVTLCAARGRSNIPSLQVARYYREREQPYAVLDPDARNAAFFKLHLEWFREWGLERALTGVFAEFPVFEKSLESLVIRKARQRNEEGGELYVNAEGLRTAVIALRSERFMRDENLVPFVRHECMHLNDMIDPRFGYSPQLQSRNPTGAQQRATRERYRLLWDITIDGRLTRAGRATISAGEQHRNSFNTVFDFWPQTKREEVFDSLWNADRPTHAELAAIASDPRELKSSSRPLPGAPCPLCGFATFEWATGPQLQGEIAAAIQSEFPGWTPDQGACSRCAEVYQLNLRHAPVCQA
jgi:hypothetical protein